MTDHEGNRKIYLARGIQEGLETADYCPRPRVIVNCFQARLNPQSQMDFSVGREISNYLFYYIIMCLLRIKLPHIINLTKILEKHIPIQNLF